MKLIYKKGSKILTNKYFLYFVFIITFIYLFQLILSKQINIIILFGLISYIIFCFNKNMAIVLGVSLIITYITTLGMKLKEGIDGTLANDVAADDPNASTTAANIQTNIQAKKTAATTSTAPATTTTTSTAPATTTTPGSDITNAIDNLKSNISSATGTTTPTASTESMNVMSNKKRNRIDYASTVQDAYEDLNNMLGQDGIKGLTLDTNRLIEQQAQLANAMKNMTPLVKTAKELLNGFNFEGMNDISNMAKQFMPSK
jgi:predicted lipid-binding transport protein (Tim44 family)